MNLKSLTVLIVVFVSIPVLAQKISRKELESKKIRLQKEIKKVNTLLINTRKEEINAVNELKDLNQKIKARSKLIETMSLEIEVYDSEISKNEKEIDSLERALSILKDDYAKIVLKSYKSRSTYSRMMFLLSSSSFHQAYKRNQYMKQYAQFRKKQGVVIQKQTIKIEKINSIVQHKRVQKEALMTETENQRAQIKTEKLAQEQLISQIKQKEKTYIKAIEVKQKEEIAINKSIEAIIKEAIAKSKRTKSSLGKFTLTPKSKLLASKFEQNKGKLPWPVANGLIVRKYGKQPHSTLKSITIQSNGIYIATDKNSSATAVFEGEVMAIQSINGRKAVYIQHGNYISLYNNLEKVYVAKGDHVGLGEGLGQVYTDKVSGKTILKFQVWKDTQRQNPLSWLLKWN